MADQKDDDIDYTAEGPLHRTRRTTPRTPATTRPRTAGQTATEWRRGKGGVFGTMGGGTFKGGMHVEERPLVYDRKGDTEKKNE